MLNKTIFWNHLCAPSLSPLNSPFCCIPVNLKCLALSPARNPCCALLWGVLLPGAGHLNIPWVNRVLSLHVKVLLFRTFPAITHWCSAFPTSRGCFCAGILTWEVIASHHFEMDGCPSAMSPGPSPLGLTRRSSWEHCQSSSPSLQRLALGNLQITAGWNGAQFDMVCVERKTAVKVCESFFTLSSYQWEGMYASGLHDK